MEQSDLYLLQTVPLYHVQAIVKARSAIQGFVSKYSGSADLAVLKLSELGEYLFDPLSCRALLHTLTEPEALVLRELIACGGRANSRDLALYLSFANTHFAYALGQTHGRADGSLSHSVPVSPTGRLPGAPGASSLYPTPHPHGAFEQALHHLLVLGLL